MGEDAPAANYAELMPDFGKLKGEFVPAVVSSGQLKSAEASKKDLRTEGPGPKDNVEFVRMAYENFDTFKAFIVDLNLRFMELDKSRDFFISLGSAEDALNILLVELNFIYESFFTKAPVRHSTQGMILRLVAFFSVVAAFIIFAIQDRMSHISDSVDIRVTYTLLLGAIGLDLLSFLIAVSSDWHAASLEKREGYKSGGGNFLDKVRDGIRPLCEKFVILKQPKWCHLKPCSDSVPLEFEVLDRFLLFRRWSGSIICHSLISYCLKGRTKKIFKFRNPISKIWNQTTGFFCQQFFTIIRCLQIHKSPLRDFVEEVRYVTGEPFPKELWEFIFEELKKKSQYADNPESTRRIYSARGDWVLEQREPSFECDGLMTYILDVEYDESLLLWHIATELLYYTEEKGKEETRDPDDVRGARIKARIKARIFSKILSGYMFYVLSFQSNLLPAVAGIDKLTVRDTCANAETFFDSKGLKADEEEKACREILNKLRIEPSAVGWRSKTVLFKAKKLAKELQKLEGDKWKILSEVWVELLSYAATHCRPYNHVQLLGKGGGLISIVWLLMAHFGFSHQFKYNE